MSKIIKGPVSHLPLGTKIICVRSEATHAYDVGDVFVVVRNVWSKNENLITKNYWDHWTGVCADWQLLGELSDEDIL
jgi:hypothetical protein